MPVSLHTHSWYSLLEGTASPATLIHRAVQGGHTCLALTDTNNLYGAVAFVELAARAGLRPIVGARLRHAGDRAVALVADRHGYANLCRILTRIGLAEVEPEALPAGGLAGLLATRAEGLHLLVRDETLAATLRPIYRERLWLEVIRPAPHGESEDRLLGWGRRLGLRPVASTAAHLSDAREYPALRVATAARRNTLLDRLPAMLAVTPEHRLLSVTEMQARFADLPEAIRHGEQLAALLDPDVLPRQRLPPRPRLTRPLKLETYLQALCERGLRERGRGEDVAARQRLRQELALIEAHDLAGYFLTVRDITREARQRGHTMALRGSAGNSLVCYLLAITDVDPLRFGLEMDRFLHPGRTDLPDIDLDFDWQVRDEIIDYVVQRHGRDHVARISAHQSFQPRSAFREAGKLHGLSSEQISELLGHLDARVDDLLPGEPKEATSTPALFPLERRRWPCIVRDARRLLGRPVQLALHPGGIVLTPQPIEEYVPLQWAAKGLRMTQFEKDAIERIGLVKIDLLGNRALASVDEARRHARTAVPDAAGSDGDPATAALLCRGDTLGVTQLESPAMRHLLLQVQPRGLGDVIQALALLRPGAAGIGVKERFIRRRRGLEATELADPALQTVLGDSHGLMLYEDDALRVIQALTGLPTPEADQLRKRISKHQTDEEEQALRQEFLTRCGRRGAVPAALEELWRQLAKFNRYSFCKSHSVSYGLIAWQAAYLKAHHPLAFWTAALNNTQGSYPRRVYVEALKRGGLELRLPCVNRSRLAFHPEEGAIRTGLEAIAGLPDELRHALLRERDDNGPFTSLSDLCRRVAIGPEALTTLIRAGALDFTGRGRPALCLEARLRDACRPAAGELFTPDPTEGWTPPDDAPARRWRDQWQTLGFVLGPPLFALCRRPFQPRRGIPLIASHELAAHAGRLVQVQGLVATGRHTFTADGRPIQFVTLEDEHGLIEVTLFSDCPQVPYLRLGPYVASGIVEDRFGACTLTARTFEAIPVPPRRSAPLPPDVKSVKDQEMKIDNSY